MDRKDKIEVGNRTSDTETDRREPDLKYEVGYRKPPVGSRFKKGQSGNPKGRKKRAPIELGRLVHDIANGPVAVKKGREIKKIRQLEATIRAQFQRALAPRANPRMKFELIETYRRLTPAPDAEFSEARLERELGELGAIYIDREGVKLFEDLKKFRDSLDDS